MKIGICCIIKNENRYLNEWIIWYLSLGFDEIHLFEDYDSLSHYDIVKLYNNVFLHSLDECVDEPLVAMHKNRTFMGCGRLHFMYLWFARRNDYNLDWCAFIDADEFICVEDNINLKEFILQFNNETCVYLRWRLKGSNGNIYRPEGSLMSNYTEDALLLDIDKAMNFKSFVNMRKNPSFRSIHEVYNGVNTLGFRSSRIRTDKKVWINHYFTKSFEDWCDRFVRGDQNWGVRNISDFFKVNNITKYDLYFNILKEKNLEKYIKFTYDYILWEPCVFLQFLIKNKECVIIIPTYKKYDDLNEFEKASLLLCINLFFNDYNIVICCPNTLDITGYGDKVSYMLCKSEYFKNLFTYNTLCLTYEFYESLNDFKYMLIYQLDAWCFSNNLSYFCQKDVDYIGSLHDDCTHDYMTVGNGGLSLRKIDKFVSICKEVLFSLYRKIWEDIVFTNDLSDKLNIADHNLGLEFGWQQNPEKNMLELNHLPFGCHGPEKYDWNFYQKYIKIF